MSITVQDLKQYRAGDTVRLVVDATVFQDFPDDIPSFRMGTGVPSLHSVPFRLVESVTLLKQAAPKVGDQIVGLELASADLPVGTVVQHNGGTVRMKQRDGRWPSGEAYSDRLATNSRYTIRFIPEPTP